MNDLARWRAEEAREMADMVERHGRLLRLAAMNGVRPELCELDYLGGTWWVVPGDWVPIVGCMMAKVA